MKINLTSHNTNAKYHINALKYVEYTYLSKVIQSLSVNINTVVWCNLSVCAQDKVRVFCSKSLSRLWRQMANFTEPAGRTTIKGIFTWSIYSAHPRNNENSTSGANYDTAKNYLISHINHKSFGLIEEQHKCILSRRRHNKSRHKVNIFKFHGPIFHSKVYSETFPMLQCAKSHQSTTTLLQHRCAH